MWFLVAASLVASASAITDLNCTSNNAYNDQAVICSNVYSDASCNILYVNSTVAAGGTDERPSNCFNGTNGFSQDLKDIAISSCPKTCGYCCQTPAYNCKNVAYPRLNCATITNRMCQDPSWREIIAADCPASCGFCLLGGCIDTAPDCETQPTICVTRGMEEFVAENCQRTCGLCSSSTTASSGGGSSGCTSYAADSSSNCANWAANGFCTNSFYTPAQRKQYCATSCKLC